MQESVAPRSGVSDQPNTDALPPKLPKSAAPRSGVSDQPNTDALPPKPPKFTKYNKLIEPRARRASPEGHSKSLPDAVKTIDFPSVLEGFWPNPSNRLPPSVRERSVQKLKICDTVVRSELGGLKSAILSITFFLIFFKIAILWTSIEVMF